MASTDNPLKQLVSVFIADFAAWILQARIQTASPLNVELPSDTVMADQVFHITLENGRELVLHIEFQERRSHQPMPWRMLDYMTRLAASHRLGLCSVVLYVGRGAGVDDTGQHQVEGHSGVSALTWQYQVIRLWQMRAEELFALEQPALLALVGQTQITQPEVVLPAVVERLRMVPDIAVRSRLVTALLALIPEEEMVQMVEQLLEDDALLLDTPFLRRIREEGRVAGREEGRVAGRVEGRVEGRMEGQVEGRMEGTLVVSRRHILRILTMRFTPPETVLQATAQALETLTDADWLEQLLAVALQCSQLADFQTALGREQP